MAERCATSADPLTAVVHLVRQAQGDLPRILQADLSARLEETLFDFVCDLREELADWDAAVRALDRLSLGRLRPGDSAAQALRAELERAGAQARQIIAAAEARTAGPSDLRATVDALALGATLQETALPARAAPPVRKPIVVRAEQTSTVAPAEVKPAVAELEPPAVTGATSKNDLAVRCPDCRAAGAIRWDRLGHVLACRSCRRYYRVSEGGQIARVDRGADGKWKERARDRPMAGWVIGSAATAALFLLALTGAFFLRPTPVFAAPELPSELEARAELLSKAWLNRDHALMRRLTLTTHEREVFGWLRRHPPPLAHKLGDDAMERLHLESHAGPKGDVTEVIVRIGGLPGQRPGTTVDFAQSWERRGGMWFFVPRSGQ